MSIVMMIKSDRFASFEDALSTLRYPYGHPRTGTPPNPHPTQPTPGPPAPAQPARSPAQSTVSSCRRPAPQHSRPLASTRSSCVTKLPTHTPTSSCPHIPPIHISYTAPSLRHPYPCTTPLATYRFHTPHASIHQSYIRPVARPIFCCHPPNSINSSFRIRPLTRSLLLPS